MESTSRDKAWLIRTRRKWGRIANLLGYKLGTKWDRLRLTGTEDHCQVLHTDPLYNLRWSISTLKGVVSSRMLPLLSTGHEGSLNGLRNVKTVCYDFLRLSHQIGCLDGAFLLHHHQIASWVKIFWKSCVHLNAQLQKPGESMPKMFRELVMAQHLTTTFYSGPGLKFFFIWCDLYTFQM